MSQFLKITFLINVSFLLSSCGLRSYTQDRLLIQPKINAVLKNVNGRSIAIRVIDDRDSTSFGNKVGSYGTGGKITSTNDLASAIEQELTRAITSAGGKVSMGANSGPVLTVMLRSVKYDAYRGLLYGGVTITCVINAKVTRGYQIAYERRYTSSREAAAAHALGGKSKSWNSDNISGVIGDTLTKIASDADLISAIAR
jgi:uncharacterized lipoprotein YajG